jgi:preprotein translocase subunit Sss1
VGNISYYRIGYSSWGKNGIYSKSEVFELIETENENYKIIKHLKISEKAKNRILSKDTTSIKTSNYKLIPKNEVQNLLIELNTNKENFTEDFLKQNFKKPTKKEILKIAKKIDQKKYFINDYDEKADTEKKYSQIQDYKYIDEYLNTNKPNADEYFVTVDVWNSLGIITFSKEQTKSYELRFLENCGQPISIDFAKLDEKEKIVGILENKSSTIINLNVNLILQKILPNNTKLWNAIDLNEIRNEYIIWYLDKKTEFQY